jgi:carbon monoxide dehydrogenase subunit G
MKLEQSFEVDAPLETVWAALIDVQRVAPCLPGAQLTEATDDGTYHGTFSVKIGPATASYRGQMQMEEVDEAAHKVTMRASGTDKRGQGGVKATMLSTLTEQPGGGTRVEVVTDMAITGRLASFSRGGMIQDVSNRLLGEFAACLGSSLQAEPEPAPADAPAPVGEPAAAGTAAPEAAATSSALTAAPGAAGAAMGAVTPPPMRPPAPAKPISGLSLVFGVLRDRLRRLLRRSPRSSR